MSSEPEPKKQSAIEFAKQKLSLNPEATYAEIKAQAKFEGIALFPVVYGRAKALLGLVPTAPYGSKSKARKQAALEKAEQEAESRLALAAPREDPGPTSGNGNGKTSRTGRAKAAAASLADPAAGLEAMIEDLRTAVRERDRYRVVLEKLGELIREELDA